MKFDSFKFLANFLYSSLYIYCSSNYRDSNSCRSFSLVDSEEFSDVIVFKIEGVITISVAIASWDCDNYLESNTETNPYTNVQNLTKDEAKRLRDLTIALKS